MATYTYPTDQNRLAVILNLDRYQYNPESLLNSLMSDQERYDSSFGIDTVSLVKTEMANFETVSAAYETAQGQQGIQSLSVAGEYSVSYAGTVQATYGPRLASIRTRILKLLDPEGQLDRLKNRTQARTRVTL